MTNHTKHNNDVIANNATAFMENAKAMTSLSKSIDDNTDATNRLGDILLNKK